jgi:hypothetical protein
VRASEGFLRRHRVFSAGQSKPVSIFDPRSCLSSASKGERSVTRSRCLRFDECITDRAHHHDDRVRPFAFSILRTGSEALLR